MKNTLTPTETALLQAVESCAKETTAIGEDILRHPELGYCESRTSTVVENYFCRLGLPVQTGLGITGVKATLDTGRPGPGVAVMGELDAVVSFGHPHANPGTGAAHACGHNAQIATLLAVASAFVNSPGVVETLCGKIYFIACPAEEYGEIEKRLQMRAQGEIEWLGGKQELLAKGFLDDVGMAMMVHASTDGPVAHVGQRGLGFVGKNIRFIGKEAHAGAAPWDGVNALNAAAAALMLIGANRESFADADGVRVHPIITRGGDLVNVVPADVRMETYVRAWNLPAMQNAAQKVDRCLEGAAYALGAQVEIETVPGYLPLHSCTGLDEIFALQAQKLPEIKSVERGGDFPGSTDMGDLSAIMPVLHPTIGGFAGAPHSKEYHVEDAYLAYVTPARALALTLHSLLENGGRRALEIKAQYPKKGYANYAAGWNALTEKSAP